jgi:hypothetical protein
MSVIPACAGIHHEEKGPWVMAGSFVPLAFTRTWYYLSDEF